MPWWARRARRRTAAARPCTRGSSTPWTGPTTSGAGCRASPCRSGCCAIASRSPAPSTNDPITRWLFTACAGRGAWLNERSLRTRPAPLSRGSLFAIRTPLEEGVPPFVEDWLRRYRLRRFGSTALHLCYVALGALDLVYDHRASLWDIAGAAPILLEAGGVLTTTDGAPLFPATAAQLAGAPMGFVAGNPASHAQALPDVAAAPVLGRQ
jgi:fructose-1,6-bisphosphatase/inositol monophosphatase family enzyme